MTTSPSGNAANPWASSKGLSARAVATKAVLAVLAGQSLDDVFARMKGLSERDAGFAKTLAYGVLREHRTLSWMVKELLSKPQAEKTAVHALLCVGLFQLRGLGTPPHAAVGETVNAAEELGEGKARGLVNAVLRRYLREAGGLEESLPRHPSIRLSYPDWLSAALTADWGDDAPWVLASGNERAPLTLRVNRRRISREAWLAKLPAAELEGALVPHAEDAVRLAEPVGVERIPGFAAGEVSVQDASAQLAVDLLALADGQRVLDACAAPGGKTAHILERAACTVTALDVDAARLARVEENLSRLGLQATVRAADAASPEAWWDGQPFDRILLDAPCSGTGVIRRHPDIKWLRRQGDIPRFAATQAKLLTALWPTLAEGGILVFATCSILRAEGEDVVRAFLAATPDARANPLDVSWGEAQGAGQRIAPGGDFDGFYYAQLQKLPAQQAS